MSQKTIILQARAPGGGRYELHSLAVQGEAELLIYGEIGEDPFADESNGAREVVDALSSLKAEYLTVRINSHGGIVSDGLAIYNAIRRHPAAVTVAVDGVAFSIASLIAMAGDTVEIAENGLMMLHAPWGLAMGNSRDLRELADTMDKYAEAMGMAYASKTGRDAAEWVALLQDGADHYYTAAEAVEAGLADRVSAETMRLAAADRARLLELYREKMPMSALAAIGPQPDPPGTRSNIQPARAGSSVTASHTEGKTMTDTGREVGSGGAVPAGNVIEINSAREEAIQAERQRVNEIRAIAKLQPAIAEDAEQAIEAGTGVDAFRAAIIPKLSNAKPVGSPSDLDLSAKDRQQYSLLRALSAYVNSDWRRAGFERECSLAIAAKAGRDPRGIFVPADLHWGSALRAATMTKQDDSTGGYLVHTDRGDFIENLRPMSVLFGLGARRMGGLVGDVSFPKKTGSAAFTWIGEDDDSPETNLTTGNLLLQNRTCSGSVPLSRKLLMQSSPDAEQVVRDDLLEGAALAVDLAGINGSGAGAEPLGILNTTGVNTQSVSSAGAPTWAETVGFKTQVKTSNALRGSLAYLTTPAVEGTMETTAKDAGSGQFIANEGRVAGFRLETSTQVPTNQIIFGDFTTVMIGFWGTIDIKVDEATKAASGGLVLRAFVDADVGTRQPTAFCIPA